MIPQYRFFLQVGANGAQVAASPVYGGNLALNYEMEQGQRFFRAKLNGKLTFYREDYDTIMAAPFGTVFYLYMEKSTDPAGMSFAPYYKSKFTITDCTVNLDDRLITVQPQTTDQYDEVLAGMDNEYNLISLTPAMNSVQASKRPLVQVYEAGADIINNYIAGTSWEQSCTANDNKNELGHVYWFGLDTIFCRIEVANAGDITGTYSGKLVRTGTHMEGLDTYEDYDAVFENDAGATDYYFNIDLNVRAGYYEDWWFGTIDLRRRAGDTSVSYSSKTFASETFNTGNYQLRGTATVNVYINNIFVMARWLTDADRVEGIITYEIPATDIAGENKNYHKAAPVSVGCCYISTNTSSTPTEYGIVSGDGTLYYAPPTQLLYEWYMPLIQSKWGAADIYSPAMVIDGSMVYADGKKYQMAGWSMVEIPVTEGDIIQVGGFYTGRQSYYALYNGDTHVSHGWFNDPYGGSIASITIPSGVNLLYVDIKTAESPEMAYYNVYIYNLAHSYSYWFAYHLVFQYLEEKGKATYFLRNAYPLWSCISVLLEAMGSSVTFDGTSVYSEFLYSDSNPLSGETVKLFVTPKSNILAGDYSVPAQKAMTTLGQFLDMLRNVYQLYWFIDADNRLRIEHIRWFKNGGSYSGSPTVGIDLTETLEKRNGTPWAYGVNEYTYEKEEMPQRYQFEWMDDERIPFKGDAIEILSPAVSEGKVENVSVGNFSSDIDYMLLNPSAFSQDGFALVGATGSGNAWTIPFMSYISGGITITLQNGYLSFFNLQPKYWVYDLPAKSVKINGIVYSLSYVSRHKQQRVTVPLGASDPDFLKLVKTNIGNGEIRAVSIPLSSRVAQVTLNYDTE